ncbi:Protein CBG11698 [Caenorhabditis briggsae]|uniref:Protein CBG11698 n=1 Tax=Caenorhabditis briggsae TaxID=6238 RepID=A8XDX9_CAEBR|nr:Protein CBG11698 [Caenorhabditis briggsae]CAP30874.2 Protein CBG11698 [Caenorhabditis briggsae]
MAAAPRATTLFLYIRLPPLLYTLARLAYWLAVALDVLKVRGSNPARVFYFFGVFATLPYPVTPPPRECSDSSTQTTQNTESLPQNLLESLQPILTSSIARHLKERRLQKSEDGKIQNPLEDVVEDPKPSNEFNTIPRISKLRDLDKILAQKSKILESLNAEIEAKRKILKIQESRRRHPETRKSPSTSEDSEDVTSSESTSSSSEASESSSESSMSSTSTETSESSKSAPKTPQPENKQEEHSSKDTTIEDPFSSRQRAEAPPLSPTTVYLENLRQQIMEKYQNKYN